jgi:hypothetical protein
MRFKDYLNEKEIDMSMDVGTIVHIETVHPNFRRFLGDDVFILGKEYVNDGKIYKKEYYKNKKPKVKRVLGDENRNGLHYIFVDDSGMIYRTHTFNLGFTTKRIGAGKSSGTFLNLSSYK